MPGLLLGGWLLGEAETPSEQRSGWLELGARMGVVVCGMCWVAMAREGEAPESRVLYVGRHLAGRHISEATRLLQVLSPGRLGPPVCLCCRDLHPPQTLGAGAGGCHWQDGETC